MAFNLQNLTKLIAEDIAKKRAISNKAQNNAPLEIKVKQAIMSISKLEKDTPHLQNSLNMINNPVSIITAFKNGGFATIAKDLIAPVSNIVIEKSFLPGFCKVNLEYKIHKMVESIQPASTQSIKNDNNNNEMRNDKHLKLVA
ncbi:MAG: hypothetical protein AB1782_00625 [Cyanobacteriota bacterium]